MERLRTSQILNEAKKFYEEKDYTTALTLYSEGIELLSSILKEDTISTDRDIIQKKIDEYMKRVSEIEETLKKLEREKHMVCIKIADGDIGYSYGSLFGKYLDTSIQRVEIDDPYIRASHQVMNLVKLCELLIHKTSIKQISITTTRDTGEKERDQLIRLGDLKCDLSSHGITLEFNFSQTLHDREIRFDNGWIIKIGRGLDYFKPMKSQFQIGFCDMDLRPCQATSVEIYNSKHDHQGLIHYNLSGGLTFNTVRMSGAEYGGDEVGAIVLDVGSYSTRVGYAGEDSPKADFPTLIGIAPSKSDDDVMETSSAEDSNKIKYQNKLDYVVGTNYITAVREGLELQSPIQDGLIDNWDLFEHLLDYVYNKVIKSEREYHPLMMTEPAWNPKAKRAQLTELMFEKYQIPAFYLAKNAVLSTFANARSTALVVDSGWEQTSVVPVHDGYALTQAIVRTPYGGKYTSLRSRNLLERMQIDLTPATHIAAKQAVKDSVKPIYTLRKMPPLTLSYMDYMKDQLVSDFKSIITQVSEDKYDSSEIRTLPSVDYEFPTGYTCSFGVERFELTEPMFCKDETGMTLDSHQPIPEVVLSAGNACDTDIRSALFSSLVVVGGNSLLKGFTDRLITEIRSKSSTSKVHKSVTNNTTVERRFSSWIGGSILASLGTFQQMWISKAEYEEHGKMYVEKKCP